MRVIITYLKTIVVEKEQPFLIRNFALILLILFSLGVLAVTVKMNLFRYNNFDFGKFDLGNMTQMVWYTLNGQFMYLTDLFGTNLPRWGMSHVDPIMVIFVPIFALFQSPLTLVFSQLVLVISSAIIIFKIVELETGSKLSALFFGLAFLFYPAVGFLLAWTGFHGVTAVIPFFLGAFYVYAKAYSQGGFTKNQKIAFWVLLVLTMMGKEQIPLYVAVFGFFVAFFKKQWRLGIQMMVVGVVWFVMAFFVIIPHYADVRIEGYERFAQSLDIDTSQATDVANENFFLSRYEKFGDSYSEVIFGMLTNPDEVARVLFSGDKPENFRMTFEPLLYSSFLYPPVFVIAVPDLLINYSTTAGGIGTSEIINHRISMIVPVLFLASILSVSWISQFISSRTRIRRTHIATLLSLMLLVSNVQTSFEYNNPVYLWLTQAIQKRIPALPVFAKTVERGEFVEDDVEVGEIFRFSPLEDKDRECAAELVSIIPDNSSISGPDYLGAHLSMRETYAIFPALYNEADYVIVDVFAQKIVRILNLDDNIIKDVVSEIVSSPNYDLSFACGNLFVFKRGPYKEKPTTLPLQEAFRYDEQYDIEMLQTFTIVDYTLPEVLPKGEIIESEFVYKKKESDSLNDYVLFLSFIDPDTGQIYQVANLPSFSINELGSWKTDRYYIEKVEIIAPDFLDPGKYKAFLGMSNRIRTRSAFLGDIVIE